MSSSYTQAARRRFSPTRAYSASELDRPRDPGEGDRTHAFSEFADGSPHPKTLKSELRSFRPRKHGARESMAAAAALSEIFDQQLCPIRNGVAVWLAVDILQIL